MSVRAPQQRNASSAGVAELDLVSACHRDGEGASNAVSFEPGGKPRQPEPRCVAEDTHIADDHVGAEALEVIPSVKPSSITSSPGIDPSACSRKQGLDDALFENGDDVVHSDGLDEVALEAGLRAPHPISISQP